MLTARVSLCAALMSSVAVAASAGAAVSAPIARLVTQSEVTSKEARTYCWPEPGKPTLCSDAPVVANPKRYSHVRRGEMVSFELPVEEVATRLRVQVWALTDPGADPAKTTHGAQVAQALLEPSAKPKYRIDLRPGRYVLALGAFWDRRDAAWTWGIEVASTRSAASAAAGGLPWPLIALVLTSLAVVAYGAIRILRRSPQHRVQSR